LWGYSVSPDSQDDDDWLHNPDPKRDKANDFGSSLFTMRGCTNIGCLLVLGIALLGLLLVVPFSYVSERCYFFSSAGYPVAMYFTRSLMSTNGGFNLGGTNASGQVPSIGNFGLIDLVCLVLLYVCVNRNSVQDTPKDVYSITSYTDGSTTMQLVFSDEFNEEGRSFYPGDDPFWEAGVFLFLLNRCSSTISTFSTDSR